MEKELLNQILANQAAIYEKLCKIQQPNKWLTDKALLAELESAAEKFKKLL